MKRIIALLLLLAAVAAGCAAQKDDSGGPDRETLFPADYMSGVAGAAMRQALDERDDAAGAVRWAWEETEGAPMLLCVEIRFPPADCDALYNRAQAGEGTSAIATPREAVGCGDDRAAHIRFGQYYCRISMLGVEDERGAAELIAARLVQKLNEKKK